MLHTNWCNIHTEHTLKCTQCAAQCTAVLHFLDTLYLYVHLYGKAGVHLFWFEGSKCSGFGQPVIINSTRLSNAAGYKGCALPYRAILCYAILDCALPYQAVLWRAERLKQNQIFPISHRQSFLPHLRPNTPSLQIGHTQTLPNLCHQLIKQSQP